MATGSDQTTGVLTGTGTQDTIVTGAHTWDAAGILFRNYSGVDVNLQVFVNGVDPKDVIVDVDLAAGESIRVSFELATGDVIKAEADAATSVSWFMDRNALA